MNHRARLWLALGRGWRLGAVLLVYGAGAVVLMAAPVELKLPQVFALTSVMAPTTTLSALAVALAALTTATEPAPQLMGTASRRAPLVNLTRVWTAATVGCVLLLVVDPDATAAVLAVLLLTGEGLVAISVVGLANYWVVPVAHVCAAITLGAVSRDEIAGWAWFLREDQGPLSVTASVAVAALGTIMWFRAAARTG